LDFAEKNELGNEVTKESETISELLLEVGATELHSRATTALKKFLDAENAELAELSGGPANLEAVTAFREKRPPDFSTLYPK
jgi:hypothetical protein